MSLTGSTHEAKRDGSWLAGPSAGHEPENSYDARARDEGNDVINAQPPFSGEEGAREAVKVPDTPGISSILSG